MNRYTKRPIVVLYLDTTNDTRRARMAARGDSPDAIETRIKHDTDHYGTFTNAVPVHVIDGNRDIESVFHDMVAIMRSYEPNREWTWEE
jgi:thymidylate kinase